MIKRYYLFHSIFLLTDKYCLPAKTETRQVIKIAKTFQKSPHHLNSGFAILITMKM